MTPSLGRVSVTNSFASLFIFYILSYLFSEKMGCLSGCLVSFANIQKLFCGICSAFKYSFDEFVGEKVVSPCYSSTILGPPTTNVYFKSKNQSIYLSGLLTFLPSVQFSYSAVSDSLQPHESQHAVLPVHHQLSEFTQTHLHQVGDAIQPSHPVVPFSCPQSLPASESFPMSQLFT